MKSRNKKRLLALVLCMVVAISNSSFIFASETGQTEYPQEAEVQTQDEAVADDMNVAAYAADEGQAVADEQPAAVEHGTGCHRTGNNSREPGSPAGSGSTCSRTADNRGTCSPGTSSSCTDRGDSTCIRKCYS